jgi:histidinol phosphatase-like PHP family hydrolase
MLCEVDDDIDSVQEQIQLMQRAYDRVIKFPNGFEVKIPIDFKLGYTIKNLKKVKDVSNTTVAKVYDLCQSERMLALAQYRIEAQNLAGREAQIGSSSSIRASYWCYPRGVRFASYLREEEVLQPRAPISSITRRALKITLS